VVCRGSLFDDFTPPLIPPKLIADPTDKKPSHWVDEWMMDDPDAVKPDDWDKTQPEFIRDPARLQPPGGWLLDEPRFVSDPNSRQPSDWDETLLGTWEPPAVANPKCDLAPGCGPYDPPIVRNPRFRCVWTPWQIHNPRFKGVWHPQKIVNPLFFDDPSPSNFEPIFGLGFELWPTRPGIGIASVSVGCDEADLVVGNVDVSRGPRREGAKGDANDAPGGVMEFVLAVRDAWLMFYAENCIGTVALSLLAVVLPVVSVACACGPEKREEEREREGTKRKDERPRRAINRRRRAARLDMNPGEAPLPGDCCRGLGGADGEFRRGTAQPGAESDGEPSSLFRRRPRGVMGRVDLEE
jgi:calnexin